MSKNLGSKKIFSRILLTTRRVTLCLIQMAAVVSVSAARTVSAIAATAKLFPVIPASVGMAFPEVKNEL